MSSPPTRMEASRLVWLYAYSAALAILVGSIIASRTRPLKDLVTREPIVTDTGEEPLSAEATA